MLLFVLFVLLILFVFHLSLHGTFPLISLQFPIFIAFVAFVVEWCFLYPANPGTQLLVLAEVELDGLQEGQRGYNGYVGDRHGTAGEIVLASDGLIEILKEGTELAFVLGIAGLVLKQDWRLKRGGRIVFECKKPLP